MATIQVSRRGYVCLWAARDIAALGDWVVLVALLAWSYHTRESAAVVSAMLLAWMLPPFLLGPLADRVVTLRNGQTFGIAANVARAAALFPLLGAQSSADLALVLQAVALASLPSAFARTSYRTLLPGLVPAGRLASAERSLSNSGLFTSIVGPAAGTAIYGMAGFHGGTTAAIAALLAAGGLMLLARPLPFSAATSDTGRPPTLSEIGRGLRHALSHPLLRPVAGIRLAVALITGGLVVVQVAYMVWGAFVTTENIGIVLAAQGLGFALASIFHGAAWRRYVPSTLMATALGIMAAAAFGFALSNSVESVGAFSLLVGLGSGLLMLSFARLVPGLVPEGEGLRASAGLNTAAEAAALVSVIALGPLADGVRPRFAIALASILLVVLALYAFGTIPDRREEDSESPVRVQRSEEQPAF